MEQVEHTDEKGRKYQALRDGDGLIVLGPPEGLVDSLGLPEPFATTLHNILFRRSIFNAAAVSKNPNQLIGALQEAYRLDVQKLTEAYVNYEKEEVSP